MEGAGCTLVSQGYGWQTMPAGQTIASPSIPQQSSQPASLVDRMTHSMASNLLDSLRD